MSVPWNKVITLSLSFIIWFTKILYFLIGELSETQKQEVEQYRAKIKQQESELTSLQQQMVKLSDIIDKQTAEIKSLNAEAK